MSSKTVTIITNGTKRVIPVDEPVFLIRGQDVVGGDAVRAWCDLARKEGASPDILHVARTLADRMDEWPKKKIPDLKGDYKSTLEAVRRTGKYTR